MLNVVIITIFVLFILVLSGIKIVKPNTTKIVVRLGKTIRIIREGLRFVIPLIDRTITVPLYKNNIKMNVNGITKDNVTVNIGLNVITEIKKDDEAILKSEFVINSPMDAITSMIDEQLRASIYDFSHQEIFGKREEIGKELQNMLKERLNEFGMELDSVQVVSIDLEEKVTSAMNKIVEAEKLKKATITEAEAEKTKKVLEAEAEKEVKRLQGEGMAEQRKAITAGFKESVDEMRKIDATLSGEKILDYILDINKQEVLENIGKTNNTKLIYLNESLDVKASERKKASAIANALEINK